MRLLPPLGALIVFLSTGTIRSQEPPLPKPQSQDPQPTVSPATGTVAAPAAPELIPPPILAPDIPVGSPPIPNPPTIPQLDEAFKQSPLSVAAENARHHLEWRALRNRAVADPQVEKALAAAETARTDLEKRKLLRQYYELYYAKMIGLASTPDLKAYLNAKKNDQLRALPQPRVRPTPSPSPTPQ